MWRLHTPDESNIKPFASYDFQARLVIGPHTATQGLNDVEMRFPHVLTFAREARLVAETVELPKCERLRNLP